jgi:hypothetical protein
VIGAPTTIPWARLSGGFSLFLEVAEGEFKVHEITASGRTEN